MAPALSKLQVTLVRASLHDSISCLHCVLYMCCTALYQIYIYNIQQVSDSLSTTLSTMVSCMQGSATELGSDTSTVIGYRSIASPGSGTPGNTAHNPPPHMPQCTILQIKLQHSLHLEGKPMFIPSQGQFSTPHMTTHTSSD